MQLVEELEQKYNAVLLSATDAQLKELELQIAEAKQKLNRDSAKERAVSDLKLASEAKARVDQAKAHLDAARSTAIELQGIINTAMAKASELDLLASEAEKLNTKIENDLRHVTHFGGSVTGNGIRFEKVNTNAGWQALKTLYGIAGKGYV